MRRKRRQPPESAGLNLTPVLGVAFLILIFFVATVPLAQERGISFGNIWDAICDCGPQTCATIVFTVDRHNRISLEHRDGTKPVDVRSVRNIVARRLAENPNCPVLVEAHPHSDMGTVVRVVDEAKQARTPPPPVSIATAD